VRLFFPLIAVSLVCLGLQFEPLASLTEWHRQWISEGQWWRIVSGNFTHTNFAHLAMNLAGLWVIHFIFKPSHRAFAWALLLISLAVGLLNMLSDMTSYVGLSGVLHGLFACFALQEALKGRKSSWLLVIGVVAKVAWEMSMGASQSTSELIQARVAVESHMFGTLSGLVFALFVVKLPFLGRLSNNEQ
tara:strand:+ start:1217 stop:1783 length:567 start_codon:yes stop_codon:yes gene_type:complete